MRDELPLSGSWATLRELEIIKTIIEVKTVTSAAEILGVSQPAISRALTQIETKSGVKFFNRKSGKLIPTSNAIALYDEILVIYNSFSKLNNLKWEKKKNHLKIVTTPTLAYNFLIPLTSNFKKEHPELSIKLDIVTSSQLLTQLNERNADVALGDSSLENTAMKYDTYPLRKIKMVCAMNAFDPLVSKDVVTSDDLKNRDIITFTNRNIARSKLDHIFKTSEIDNNVIIEVPDSLSALGFVRENIGISILPSFPASIINEHQVILRDFSPEIYNSISFFVLSDTINVNTSNFIEYIYNHQPGKDRFSYPITQ
ncbi:LysR family transcriptional regulator [Vibrio mangrovi]|uniref:HTH-type transcriptional regulator CynR n=1 Tax=Vibrio mangrovi TaxID=474394 RepID=A0A1Y6IXZ6_9VIBR|nr:LysR family transcriptional regulator [Vibrio mangrovi]MDW6004623.1 LysR family transcriptional regulator [Vibrio mangrovi]SMS00913.1 HTH-type transcriptional regulator CynR [Vibrio mangrovi]